MCNSISCTQLYRLKATNSPTKKGCIVRCSWHTLQRSEVELWQTRSTGGRGLGPLKWVSPHLHWTKFEKAKGRYDGVCTDWNMSAHSFWRHTVFMQPPNAAWTAEAWPVYGYGGKLHFDCLNIADRLCRTRCSLWHTESGQIASQSILHTRKHSDCSVAVGQQSHALAKMQHGIA